MHSVCVCVVGVSEHNSTLGMFCIGIFLKIYGCHLVLLHLWGYLVFKQL